LSIDGVADPPFGQGFKGPVMQSINFIKNEAHAEKNSDSIVNDSYHSTVFSTWS
jgi:hypothetical protein